MSNHVDSYYARTLAEPADYPRLEGEIETETLVIGGGLAGCALALDLAERGRKVVLLEAHEIGWGASGRNGGFVSIGVPNGIPALVKRVGLATAQEIYRAARMGHALLRQRIARYAIACGPIQEGALRCNMARERESLEAFCAMMARDFDTQYEYWPKARLREALATTQYGDAFLNPHTFTLHPLNLVRGIARAAAANGARILTRSPALALTTRGARKEARGEAGRVRADHLVIACGGYIDGLHGAVSAATVPIATFVMATEPLGERLKQAIRVPYAISDIKVATNYYRPLADTRLLWGGRVLAWEPGAAHLACVLRRDMAAFYPGLATARVETAWGGLMPLTRHKLPVFGEIEPGVWYATGFGGLGLALTTTAGRLIAAGIVEGDESWRLFARLGLPYAGGKLGRIPAQLIYWRHQAAASLSRLRVA
ncbi:MAG TPA: FAD-binding oxidoreductase [Stellaceae bacterium]|nr:FAD-binding oxidoreductase [Stellaceae bacterium]